MKQSLKTPGTLLAIALSLFFLIISFFILKTRVFDTGKNSILTEPISTLILPHHDLAASQRLAVLSQIAGRVEPKTIILVSPNHFNAGGYNILTTSRQWRLMNSYFSPDKEKLAKLNLAQDDLAFDREHGIYNLLQPLKDTFPDSKIIPIMIKQETSALELDQLVNNLNKICSSDCLLVSSIDFSHYQPASVASIHDALSIKALSNLDENLAWAVEVDSNPTFYLTQKWAKLKKTFQFHLAENTNSGLLEHSPDAESTSYVLGWFELAPAILNQSQTFVVGYNLSKIKDPRLITGTDQKIDLANSHDMALICLANNDYCALNRLLWGPNFYRDILNGLVIEGEIQTDNYKLVLVPTKDNVAVQGDEKLAVINKIRAKLGLDATQIKDGYDIVNIPK